MSVDDFIEASNRAGSSLELVDLFRSAINDYGYENVIVAEICGTDIMGLPILICPEGYPQYYFDSRFQEIDPVLPLAMTARLPYHWNDIGKSVELSVRQKDFFMECTEAGVADGITVPIRGPRGNTTVVSLSCRNRNPDAKRFTAHLNLLTIQFDTVRWQFLNPVAVLEQPIELTARERECLRWCKAGKSAWEASQILGIAERTVQFHVSNAMAKLGAPNRITAVVMAIQRGLLSL